MNRILYITLIEIGVEKELAINLLSRKERITYKIHMNLCDKLFKNGFSRIEVYKLIDIFAYKEEDIRK